MTLTEQISREPAFPVLRTERLTLRVPRPSDAENIALIANDRRIAENTARIPHPYGIAEAEQFITEANGGAGDTTFAIILHDEAIGACNLDPRKDGPEVGCWLGATHWGNGYATEAVRALIDHAFGDLKYEVLQSGARVTNPASRRVLEKCGFQWTGVRLCRIRAINSAAPVDRFRLDRGLWASLKARGRVKRVA
jgi:RimJ/RimL family protein N-acetyltransferase